MYEHPYLAYRATALELEQTMAAAERRRAIAERADQIRPRERAVGRMLRAFAARRPRQAHEERCPAGRDCAAVTA